MQVLILILRLGLVDRMRRQIVLAVVVVVIVVVVVVVGTCFGSIELKFE